MRQWHLTQSDPFTLRLAADVRLGATDYGNDHIWAITLAEGDPPALAVRTTYGLRAQEMRLFASFMENDRTVTDPAEFAVAPVVRSFFVNYTQIAFEPFEGVQAVAEYWVPDSHTLTGQVTLTNPGSVARRVSVLLTGQLKLLGEPQPMTATQLENLSGAGLLEGQTANLDIVVLLEGRAEPLAGAHPTV